MAPPFFKIYFLYIFENLFYKQNTNYKGQIAIYKIQITKLQYTKIQFFP